MTVYAKTEFFDGTTLVGTVSHTNASSIATIGLTADGTSVKYGGTAITTAIFTPLDVGLTASFHSLDITGTCGMTIRLSIPSAGQSDSLNTYACSQGTGWTFKVETKAKVAALAAA